MKEIQSQERQAEFQWQNASVEQFRETEASAACDEIDKIGDSSWEDRSNLKAFKDQANTPEVKKGSSDEESFEQLTSNEVEDINLHQQQNDDVVLSLDDFFSQKYNDIVDYLESKKVEYRPIQKVDTLRTESEIIANLGGGDLTDGSCSSLALAYAGNKAGFDVKDFRDGESRTYFSHRDTIKKISELPDVKSTMAYGSDDIKCANDLLQKMEPEKEYYLVTGAHAAIVRQHETRFEYLELQSPKDCGWHALDNNELKSRFGCEEIQPCQHSNFLIEVDSLSKSQEFQMILGYVNTSENNQMKGGTGYAR